MSQNWRDWANRRSGRGGAPAEAHHQPPQQAAYPQLAPPPPGYAWAQTPAGIMLVQVAPQSSFPPPVRQPQGVVPYVNPGAPAYVPGAPPPSAYQPPPKSCVLVRDGGVDKWAETLASLPDLVPPTPYDAMSGRTNPAVLAELGGMPEFNWIMVPHGGAEAKAGVVAPPPMAGMGARGSIPGSHVQVASAHTMPDLRTGPGAPPEATATPDMINPHGTG